MSLRPPDRQRTIFEVSHQVDRLFDPRSRYRLFREKVMPALWRARREVAELYCGDNGRPPIEPVLLMGVTLLQFMERLPDRQAAEQVRLHLGWKYALDLELDDTGFHPTTLVKFRQRLASGDKARVVFDAVLDGVRGEGLLKGRRRVRLDSTHVLGLVAEMSRTEVVRETIRLVLEAWRRAGVADGVPGLSALVERYVETTVDWSRQDRQGRRLKLEQAGRDALALVCWARLQSSSVRSSDAVLLLERVLCEQFDLTSGELDAGAALPSNRVQNPHDPDVEWSTKDTVRSGWTGYKVQLSETVSPDGVAKPKGEPTEQFITDMATTSATTGDTAGMARMDDAARARGEALAAERLVDTAYVSGATLAEARDAGRELLGPARPAQGQKGLFKAEAFAVDLASKEARCPAGKTSTSCRLVHDRERGRRLWRFRWGAQCNRCSLQSRCTRRQNGRRWLTVGEHHDLVQARREAMKTEAFRDLMHQRAGVEGTISEAKRTGLARTRYRGLAKTSLCAYLVGAACNVRRWLRRASWELALAPALAG